jgi:predicted nucleic acid-binding protein
MQEHEVVALDASAIIELLSKKVDGSDNKRERLQCLVDKVRKNKGRVLIPTPALTEFSVYATPQDIEFLLSQTFKIAPLDIRAALECGQFIKQLLSAQKAKKSAHFDKLKMKFDLQILAIAKANNVTLFVTDDKQLLSQAAQSGVNALPVSDLPLPDEARQYPLL